MQKVYIPMEQCWDNIDDAVKYFLEIVEDLRILQQLSDPPTDLYLSITDAHYDLKDPSVTLISS